MVGWEARGRMPSVDMTAMGDFEKEIFVASSSYAPWSQDRLSHPHPPVVGGGFALETLGLLISSILNSNVPDTEDAPDATAAIAISLTDILPSFPGAY